MTTSSADPSVTISDFEQKIGYTFADQALLVRALTHKSYDNENAQDSVGHNEVLEFIGDAVLDLVLGRLLMDRFPNDAEGALSKKRASLVNEAVLSELAKTNYMDTVIRLGRGERATGGAKRPRLLSSAFEAVLGAIFLDGGYERANEVARNLYEPILANHDWSDDYVQDYKTRLQEKLQSKFGVTPHYIVRSQTGPDHERRFEVEVWLGEKRLAEGQGTSKKAAEQDAARRVLEE